jgi:hypothetical protein
VELFERLFGLGQVKAHAAQNIRCFGELQIAVLDHLDPVTPGVEEVEKISIQHFGARFDREITHSTPIIDDKTEMPILIRTLMASSAQSNELIAQIDKCHHHPTVAILV